MSVRETSVRERERERERERKSARPVIWELAALGAQFKWLYVYAA